jgi:hypothetical protein
LKNDEDYEMPMIPPVSSRSFPSELGLPMIRYVQVIDQDTIQEPTNFGSRMISIVAEPIWVTLDAAGSGIIRQNDADSLISASVHIRGKDIVMAFLHGNVATVMKGEIDMLRHNILLAAFTSDLREMGIVGKISHDNGIYKISTQAESFALSLNIPAKRIEKYTSPELEDIKGKYLASYLNSSDERQFSLFFWDLLGNGLLLGHCAERASRGTIIGLFYSTNDGFSKVFFAITFEIRLRYYNGVVRVNDDEININGLWNGIGETGGSFTLKKTREKIESPSDINVPRGA